jgi:hypothetical protein
MAIREGPAGCGFQVLLKTRGVRLIRELDDDVSAPRAVLGRMRTASATEPIDDTSTGKLMEGVLAAFAHFDRDPPYHVAPIVVDEAVNWMLLRWSGVI